MNPHTTDTSNFPKASGVMKEAFSLQWLESLIENKVFKIVQICDGWVSRIAMGVPGELVRAPSPCS